MGRRKGGKEELTVRLRKARGGLGAQMELVVAGDRRRSRNGDRLDSVNAEASSSNERSERKEETQAELPSWSESRGDGWPWRIKTARR